MSEHGIQSDLFPYALVAQLDRAPDFESGCRGFESLRVYQIYQPLSQFDWVAVFVCRLFCTNPVPTFSFTKQQY